MKLVIIESPFAGDRIRNDAYLDACLRDSLLRGETPYASAKLLATGNVLNDDVAAERELGIAAGHAWMTVADLVAMYVDFGMSPGMRKGLCAAKKHFVRFEYRTLGITAKDLESNVLSFKPKS